MMEGFKDIAPGMTLVDSGLLQSLITQVRELQTTVLNTVAELKDTKKPYLSAQEVMELTGFGKTWLNDNKQHVGFTTIGGCLRFKRKDVEEFIETNYFKIKLKKRYV